MLFCGLSLYRFWRELLGFDKPVARHLAVSSEEVGSCQGKKKGNRPATNLVSDNQCIPGSLQEPIIVPPVRLHRLTASTIKEALDAWMPLTASKRLQ